MDSTQSSRGIISLIYLPQLENICDLTKCSHSHHLKIDGGHKKYHSKSIFSNHFFTFFFSSSCLTLSFLNEQLSNESVFQISFISGLFGVIFNNSEPLNSKNKDTVFSDRKITSAEVGGVITQGINPEQIIVTPSTTQTSTITSSSPLSSSTMVELGGVSLVRGNTVKRLQDLMAESSYDPQHHLFSPDHSKKRRASDADTDNSPRRESITTITSLGTSPISVVIPSSLSSSSSTRHSGTPLSPPSPFLLRLSTHTHEDDESTFSRDPSLEMMKGGMDLLGDDGDNDDDHVDPSDLRPTNFLYHDETATLCTRSRTESSYLGPDELPPVKVCLHSPSPLCDSFYITCTSIFFLKCLFTIEAVNSPFPH